MRIKTLTNLICLSFIVLGTPLLSTAQSKKGNEGAVIQRKYKPGDRYRYRLTTTVVQNGQWQWTIVAICELQVVTDSNGIPWDEVHWVSKKVMKAKDTSDQTQEAAQVKPYRISLHPKGQMNIPTIDIADM